MNRFHSIMRGTLIKGTLILTLAGLLSRLIGFFYRICLSRYFTGENIGIYQLITPILALTFALTAAGLQTAISRLVAQAVTHSADSAYQILCTALFASLILSVLTTAFLLLYSEWVACFFLKEERTAPLIRIVALSVPFASIHSCINGFFYGLKRTGVPALSQLLEQFFRVAFVFLFCAFLVDDSNSPKIIVAAIGLLIGEIFSSIFSLICCFRTLISLSCTMPIPSLSKFRNLLGQLFSLSWPLTASRVIITLLLSIEASYIPECLEQHGMSTADSLTVYGILTGMSLPLILFPSALTNSVSVLLLPIISEADGKHNISQIVKTTRRCVKYCLLLGFAATIGFYFLGLPVTSLLFHNTLAGEYVRRLSLLCPFLYLGTTLGSILHGLGKTKQSFFIQLLSLSSRLFFVFVLIPDFGIQAYFMGLFLSQMFLSILYLLALRKYLYYT